MFRNIFLVIAVFLTVPISASVYEEENQEKNMQVNVIITFNVKPDKLDSFLGIMGGVKSNQPNIKGWSSVKIYNDIEKPTIFTLIELWDSKEQHQRHLDGVVESGDWENISSHLISDPVSSYFKRL
jgi:quinol monooxygenase YgiN